MKKILAIFCLFITSAAMYAQTDSIDAPKKNPARDRFIFDIHWSGWLNAPDSMGIKGFSSGVGFHFFYDVPFAPPTTDKSSFSFAIGIGYACSNYYNKSYFSYDTADITYINPYADGINFKKNKLVLNYLEVPIEFRFRSKENNKGNSFKIAAGFKAGYQFSNHTKYVGDDYIGSSTDEIKFKQYHIHNLNKLQYGPTFRLGYGNINLEAYYGLNTIFETDNGPDGTPLTVGVSFNPF